jgi:hypothetical protein
MQQKILGNVAAAWAVVGWSAVLAIVIARLGVITLEPLTGELTPVQLVALVANVLFMAYAEGYRGFELKFSPRAAARVLYLRGHAGAGLALLAPLFLIGYFGATPRILRVAWVGTALIIGLVLIVQQLPQPWRGIVDAGVVVGLSWGLWSFWRMTFAALRSGVYPVPPEVAGRDPTAAALESR